MLIDCAVTVQLICAFVLACEKSRFFNDLAHMTLLMNAFFSRYNTRHVALKIAYLGWDYQGFAVQEETENTIEEVLFQCLKKTRLIESRYAFI